jgi:hypothetical protein
MQLEAMHAARLANIEAAVCGLLRAARQADPNDTPDGLTVRVYTDEGGDQQIDVEYTRGGRPVWGESV